MISGSEKAFLDDLLGSAIPANVEGRASSATDTDEAVDVPVPIQPFTKKNFLFHHDTHPILLDVVATSKYGSDWFDWEPETLWTELQRDFSAASISEHTKSKLQAMKTIHSTNLVHTNWEVFCPTVQALNNNIPDFEVLRRPTLSQLFSAVDIITMTREGEDFSSEVKKFCAASMLDSGVYFAPVGISFCQEDMNEFLAHRDIPFDVKAVEAKYLIVRGLPPEDVHLEENPIDVQVHKLLIASDYLNMRREQLIKQLKIMGE